EPGGRARQLAEERPRRYGGGDGGSSDIHAFIVRRHERGVNAAIVEILWRPCVAEAAGGARTLLG
ncbi:MAG: hypothetical protein ACJ76P_03875, partial [Actinomycetota bacterium]